MQKVKDNKIEPTINNTNNELDKIRQNSRDLIKYNIFKKKEKSEIMKTKLNIWQSIIVGIADFFINTEKMKKNYKITNYNNNIEKGLIEAPVVFEAEIDAVEIKEQQIKASKKNNSVKKNNSAQKLSSLRDIQRENKTLNVQ